MPPASDHSNPAAPSAPPDLPRRSGAAIRRNMMDDGDLHDAFTAIVRDAAPE